MNQTMLGQQITQLLQMVAFGWVLMLTADEKKALAACGRWSYRKKAVGDFLFCLLWGLLFWLFLVNNPDVYEIFFLLCRDSSFCSLS